MERRDDLVGPLLDARRLEHGRERDADPASVAGVFAANLVRDAGQGDVAFDRRVVEQLVESQGDLAVDHPVDPQAPLVGRDGGDLQGRVDPVERLIRGDERGDSRDAEVGACGDRAEGLERSGNDRPTSSRECI